MKRLLLTILEILILLLCVGCKITQIDNLEATPNDSEISNSQSEISESQKEMPTLDFVPEEYVIEWENEEAYTEDYFIKQYEGSEFDRQIDIQDDNITVIGQYEDSLPIINNTVKLEEVMSYVDDIQIINSIWYTLPYMPSYLNATETTSLQNILSNTMREGGTTSEYVIPVNFLRQMECKDFFYTVMEFNDGYAYAVFGRPMIGNDDNGNPIYATEDITDLKFYGGIYATDSVEYKDFENITIGSSIFDVIQIEPAAEHVLQLHRSYRAVGVPFFRDMHQVLLLEDGLLEIIYEPREKIETDYYGEKVLSNESDDLIVSSIAYYPDFMYKSNVNAAMVGTDKIPSIPIQILPQDYPPAS